MPTHTLHMGLWTLRAYLPSSQQMALFPASPPRLLLVLGTPSVHRLGMLSHPWCLFNLCLEETLSTGGEIRGKNGHWQEPQPPPASAGQSGPCSAVPAPECEPALSGRILFRRQVRKQLCSLNRPFGRRAPAPLPPKGSPKHPFQPQTVRLPRALEGTRFSFLLDL